MNIPVSAQRVLMSACLKKNRFAIIREASSIWDGVTTVKQARGRLTMDGSFTHVIDQLVGRSDGPLHFRFILQPAVASIIAVRAGLKDATAHRPAYLWTALSQPQKRHALGLDAWKDVGKVFIIAFLLDIIYQVVVFRWIYPMQAVIVGFALAIVPYILLRGPVNRIASRCVAGHPRC